MRKTCSKQAMSLRTVRIRAKIEAVSYRSRHGRWGPEDSVTGSCEQLFRHHLDLRALAYDVRGLVFAQSVEKLLLVKNQNFALPYRFVFRS